MGMTLSHTQSEGSKVDNGGIAGGTERKALVMDGHLEATLAVSKLGVTRSREWMHQVISLLDAAVGQLHDQEHPAQGTLLEAASLLRQQIHPPAPGEVPDERGRLRPSPKPEGARTWPFKVFVLGRFQVLKDDAPIRFSGRQQRKPLELLQALIAFGSTEVGAGKLANALWPDSEGDAGYHALESTLYRLRQLLGASSAVVMAGGKLTLDRRQVWVDMWAFESKLRAGNADNSSAAERLARLRELYSGHFLAQEAEKSWAVEKRQSLRERFVRAIGDFARSYEKRGLWQEAAGVYQVGIEVNSLAEEFHRGLMMCHRELGDRGAAVQAYRRCSELLLKRLGVQPSSKTLALYQSVRHDAMSHELSSNHVREQPPFEGGVFGGIGTEPKSEIP
jgi:DNA-binding SARP family transcriptional activator